MVHHSTARHTSEYAKTQGFSAIGISARHECDGVRCRSTTTVNEVVPFEKDKSSAIRE